MSTRLQLCTCALGLSLLACGRPAPSPEAPQVSAFQAGTTRFALHLAQAVAEPGQNLVVSPWSVSSALGLVSAGARHATLSQLEQTLAPGVADAEFQAAMANLRLELGARNVAEHTTSDGSKSVALASANSLWHPAGLAFAPAFLDATKRDYGASVLPLDFTTDPTPTVNQWVSDATAGNIKDLVSTIEPGTPLLLINALYLKADWQTALAEVGQLTFHAPAGDVPVTRLGGEQMLPWAEGDGWQLTELPYEGGQLRMTLVVPAAGRFDELAATMDGPWLTRALAATKAEDTVVNLPRFSFRTKVNLGPTLQAMGIVDAFEPARADLSGMGAAFQSSLDSAVAHEAVISVNARGTEASAATSVGLLGGRPPPPAHTLVIDRPFFFFIRDQPTGALLFAGRVLDPTKG